MIRSTKVQDVFEVQDERGNVRTFHQTSHDAAGYQGYVFVGKARVYGAATVALFFHAGTGAQLAGFYGRGKHAHLVQRLPLAAVSG